MAGSLRPSDAKTGGLLDDANVTIRQARFVRFDFGGKAEKPRLCLAVEMIDGDGRAHTEYYSAGDMKFFVPTADGKGYDSVADKTALYRSCNAVVFIESIVAAGFPESKLGNDISVIEGLKVHVSRVAQKTRKFQDGRTSKDDATVLVVDAILSMPPTSTAAADIVGKAEATILAAILANHGPLPMGRVQTDVFKALMGDPQCGAVMRILTPEFLTTPGRPWIVDASDKSLVGI